MILWLDPFSGVSGDMLLGALLELGAPLDEVRAAVASTGLTGWELHVEPMTRAGLAATRAVVTVADSATERPTTERPATELLALARRARPEPVAALAERAIMVLATTEAGLHGVAVEAVHLHELGGVDTVVDVVGVAAALHLLGVTRVHCGSLALGSGTVRTRHGELPLPAPAAAALLARGRVPVVPAGVPGETVTPTGIALLLAADTCFGPVPAMTVTATGYGAGGREVADRPNVLPALLGTAPARAVGTAPEALVGAAPEALVGAAPEASVGAAPEASVGAAPEALTSTAPGALVGPAAEVPVGMASAAVEQLLLLETNVDDVSGEVLGYLLERLLATGAADAWVSPIVMKKSRPAHTVHVLADPAVAAECERVVFAETGSLGVRRSAVDRVALPRRATTVHIEGHRVRLKHGPWGVKAEHDDVAAAATALGLPLREVARRAVAILGR